MAIAAFYMTLYTRAESEILKGCDPRTLLKIIRCDLDACRKFNAMVNSDQMTKLAAKLLNLKPHPRRKHRNAMCNRTGVIDYRGSKRRSRPFNVTDFGSNEKPIYDLLLVNTTNLRCI